MRTPSTADPTRALAQGRLARECTPERVARVGVALGAVSMTCTGLQLSLGPDPYERAVALAILAGTLAWSAVAAVAMRRLLRGRLEDADVSPPGYVARGVVSALMIASAFGFLNTLTAIASVELVADQEVSGRLLGGVLCLGPMVGAPFGATFGACYLWALWTPERARLRQALDHLDTTLARVGTWLVGAGASGALLSRHGTTEALQWTIAATGALAVGVVLVRDRRRAAWLRALYRAGTTDGVLETLDARAPGGPHHALPAVVDVADRDGMAWLQRERAGTGPFREGELARPVATLPESWAALRAHLRRRTALVLLTLLWLTGAAVARVTVAELPLGLDESLPAVLVPGRGRMPDLDL